MRLLTGLITLAIPLVCSAQTQLVRAAGMPLPDGALPPGMLTVRVVQGGFSANLPGELIEVDVTGRGRLSTRTGDDGRAQFAHLPIGATVRALATIGTERFESEAFEMPAESGVRLLFVAEGGAATTPAGGGVAAASPASPIAPVAASPAIPSRATSEPTDPGVATVRVIVIALTVLAFVLVILQQRRELQKQAEAGE
jgi:hypothetical protein